MKTIEEFIENKRAQSKIWNQRIRENKNNLEKFSLNFRFLEETLAVKSLIDNDFKKVKNHYYLCGLIDELRVLKFNNNLFDYGLPYMSYPLLSDNEKLILRYSKLRYQPWGKMEGMDESVSKGKSAIWCNTIQFFMANDLEGVERNLNTIETITLKKLPKNQQELKFDYEFYIALLNKDKNKCEEILEQLVSPKIHKKRNSDLLLRQYISQPALGYAKLAWRQGIEVEVNSPLIPKKLLPIQPLESYEISYDFLKNDIVNTQNLKRIDVFKKGIEEFNSIIKKHDMLIEYEQDECRVKIHNGKCAIEIFLSRYYYELTVTIENVKEKRTYSISDIFHKKQLFDIQNEYLKKLIEKYKSEVDEKTKLLIEFKIIAHRLNTYCPEILDGDFSKIE